MKAILEFDLDEPDIDNERRLRECLDALKAYEAVKQFEQWLNAKIDSESDLVRKESLDDTRNMLFDAFKDNDVIVPGWE